MGELSLDMGKDPWMSCILIIGYCEPPFVIIWSFFHGEKLWWRHCSLLFYISSSCFFPLRRVVMRARRHVIINANYTIFIVCSSFRLPWAGESEQEEKMQCWSWLYVGGNDAKWTFLFSHIYACNRAYLDIPRNPRLSWLREWWSNDQWFSRKCPCNCESEATRPLIELIRIYNRKRKISLLNMSYHCCRMIDDWTL